MMAAVEKAHVESPADLKDEDTEPQDDSNNSGSDGGSEGEGSDEGGSEGEGSDEGGSDDGGQSDSGSDGEQAEDENGEEEGNEDNKEAGEGEANPNAGWAEAMAKILQKKTPESKPTILLKNKQLDKLKEKEKKEWLEKKKQIDKKRAWEMMSREKPDLVKDRENERNLQRIATRGVVQLFNAVRKHQKTMDDKVKEVGGSERKKVKLLSSVSKKDFINVLRGTEGAGEVKSEKQTAGGQSEEKPAWSVLRDDYMMGASMKDWDKESDEEGGGGGPETKGGAEDYNSDSD